MRQAGSGEKYALRSSLARKFVTDAHSALTGM